MPGSKSLFRSLVAAAVVAIGVAAFWCAATNWLIETAKNALEGHQPFENIYVTRFGQPVIVRSRDGNTQNTEQILSLDRRPLSVSSQDLRYLNPLDSQGRSRYASIESDWNARIAGINDGGVPPVYWYVFHDGQVPGHAYGVGFSASTRTVRGYFGRRGFSDALPPRDDWFDVPGTSGLYGLLSSISFGQEPRYSTGMPSFLFLADGKLLRVDLAKKQIDALFDCPQAFRIGQVYRLRETQAVSNQSDSSEAATTFSTPIDGIVREPDRLIVVRPRTGEQISYPLPEPLREVPLNVAVLPSGELLLVASDHWRDGDGTVIWLTQAGEITKEQPIRLYSRYTSTSWSLSAWQWAVSSPYPLASAAFAFLYAPHAAIQQERAETYPQGFAFTLSKTWPSWLAVLALSTAAAIFAYRRQRRFGLAHAAAWAVFVFVGGLPGYLAYRFHRAWPVLEECPACHQAAPRDRETCLDCGASFPPPKLKGIEVFA